MINDDGFYLEGTRVVRYELYKKALEKIENLKKDNERLDLLLAEAKEDIEQLKIKLRNQIGKS